MRVDTIFLKVSEQPSEGQRTRDRSEGEVIKNNVHILLYYAKEIHIFWTFCLARSFFPSLSQ